MKDPETRDLADVIRRAKDGDSEAFSYLYAEYFTPVYRYLYFRTRSAEDAEDLAQDVFVKAYGGIAKYAYTGQDPLAYFYVIARNALIDRGRKKRVATLGEEFMEDVPDLGRSAEDQLRESEEAKQLRDYVAQLPPDQQETITLRFIQELSTKEAAALMGKKEEAVRKLQSRGLRSLRDMYETNE